MTWIMIAIDTELLSYYPQGTLPRQGRGPNTFDYMRPTKYYNGFPIWTSKLGSQNLSCSAKGP